MPNSIKKWNCILLTLMLLVSFVIGVTGCSSNQVAETQETTNPISAPEVITDTGAGDNEKQLSALKALNALRGATEENRLTELNTQLSTCPFCGKAATWSAFQYDGEDPNKIVTNKMSDDANAPSHFYVYGDKTTIEGNWLVAPKQDTQHYACILLDGNIASDGCVLAFHPAIVSIGGRGSITTTTTGQGGLFAFDGAKLQHELNLYGGTFSSTGNRELSSAVIHTKDPSSVVNIWSDDVVIGGSEKPEGKSERSYNICCGGILNMYGGTIQNGRAGTGSTTEESGNLHLMPGSTFNMYGGTIKNGYARKGANIYISASDLINAQLAAKEAKKEVDLSNVADNPPVVTIYDGVIQDGYATSNGGGIFNKSSKLSIQGGKLLNNISVITGGNFWTNQTVEIKNTLISGGESTHSHGGNIFLSAGDLLLDENTVVENGKAKGRAGNVYVNPSCTLTVNGKIIQTTDEVHAEFGGNIYLAGTAIINGVISGGHSSGGGGNIYVVINKATVVLGDGEVKDGIDDSNDKGGNINFVTGTLRLSGSGKIDGGIWQPNIKNAKLVVDKDFSGEVSMWRDGSSGKVGGTAGFATCKGKFTGIVINSNGMVQMKRSGSALKYAAKVAK